MQARQPEGQGVQVFEVVLSRDVEKQLVQEVPMLMVQV
jgi:hypothetical protein